MGDKSKIEWCDATWNPIRGVGSDRWLCQKVSPGCDNCYASSLNQSRIFNPHSLGSASAYPEAGPIAIGTEVGAPGDRPLVLDEAILNQPLHWKRPRKVFVCSMTDLFGEWVQNDWLDHVFAVMASAPHHTFQVLTKRPKRMRDYLSAPESRRRIEELVCAVQMPVGCPLYGCSEDCEMDGIEWPLPNVWLGVTVESQAYAWRLNYLMQTPAAIRFMSAEPLLGALELPANLLDWAAHGSTLDWVITGGESGPDHRPFDPAWADSIRRQCEVLGAAFLHKQNGGRTSKSKGRELFGKVYDGYPQVAA